MPDVITSQVEAEVLAAFDPALIETQVVTTVLGESAVSIITTQGIISTLAPSIEWMTNPPVHATQEEVEILGQCESALQSTQCFIDVLGASDEFSPLPSFVETQQHLDTLSGENANLVSTQFCVQVLAKAPREKMLYLDSCQRCAAVDLPYAYTVSGSVDISTLYRRARQTQSYRLPEDGFISKPVANFGTTVFIGAAVRLGNYPSGEKPIFQLMDGEEEVIGLYLGSNGIPRIKTGSYQYVAGVSPISTTRFQYLELRGLFDNTNGVVSAWVDGVKVCEALGQDTVRTTHGFIDSARWVGAAASFTYVTSLYFLSYSGKLPDALPLGNIEIHPYMPVSDIVKTGWKPNVGVNLFHSIDEPTPNPDDYIFSSSDGDQYTLRHGEFSYPNPSGDNRILGVQLTYLAQNPSESEEAFRSVITRGALSTEGYADFTVTPGAGWQFFEEGYSADMIPWGIQGVTVNTFYWGGIDR